MWIIDLPELDASGTISPKVLTAIASGAVVSRHPTNVALIRLGFATEAAATAFATSIGTGADTINDAGTVSFIVDHTTFLTSVSQGALIATLSQPYGAGTTYEVIGTPPATLSVTGASVKATSTAPTANTIYPVTVRATSADGTRDITETFDFAARQAPGATPTPTPAPTLGTIALSGTLSQNVAASGVTISGLTDGSTVTFSIAGLNVGTSGTTRTVSGTPTGSGSLNVTETLVGASNSPRTTSGIATIVAAPSLGTLTLSGTLTNGTPSSGTILGATAGSTITSSVTGLTVNSSARTYAFDGTGAGGSYSSGLTETLSGATNSPKVSAITIAMAAPANLILNPTGVAIRTDAVPSTVLSSISNVPNGVTPTLTPNDGRFVISGATGAWSVSLGSSAISVGTVNVTVSASGAVSAVLSVAISAAMLPYTLIHDFESIGTATADTGAVISLDNSNRKALNGNGLRLVGNSVNTAAVGAKNVITTTRDFSQDSIIAMCVDFGNKQTNIMNDVRLSISGGYGYYPPSNASFNASFDFSIRGKVWLSWKVSNFKIGSNGASIQAAGNATKVIGVSATPQPGFSNGNVDVVVDALISVDPAKIKPVIMFTFDDVNINQVQNGEPIFDYFGFPATIYVPPALVNTGSGRYTLADLKRLKAKGWGMCVDSAPEDNPLTAETTLQGSIDRINQARDWVAENLGPEGVKHMCWSYNNTGYKTQPSTYSCTSNGANPSTITVSGAYSNLCPGMKIFDSGVLVGEVVKVTSQTTADVSTQLPAGTRNLTFSARVMGLTSTCDGTNVVTLSSTANLFAGMYMLGYSVPDGTKIVSIDSANSRVTVSNNVPATCKLAEFAHLDGEYWPTKIIDKLIENGYVTGRKGVGNGAVFSQYGCDPKYTLCLNALVSDNASATATLIAQLQHNVSEGRDTLLYGHNVQAADVWVNGDKQQGIDATKHWPTVLSTLRTMVDAGVCDVVAVPTWWDKVQARSPIA